MIIQIINHDLEDHIRIFFERYLKNVYLSLKSLAFNSNKLTSDFICRTNLLLEKVCDGVSPPIFYTCLWECLLSNAAVRLPAILFVLSHFKRHIPMRDQVFLMGNDVNSLVC